MSAYAGDDPLAQGRDQGERHRPSWARVLRAGQAELGSSKLSDQPEGTRLIS